MPRYRDRYTPVEQFKVTVPTPVVRAFRSALAADGNPSRMKYGAASAIVTHLLREWLRTHNFPEELHEAPNER